MWYVDLLIGITVCAVLLYGAIWDAKARIIPNSVPVTIAILGAMIIFVPEFSFWYIPLSVWSDH